jgi:hypothetical protein
MKRALPILILLLCAGVFAVGILELFKLRFDAGDVYPPYSTLRADPLGASAFYESLARIPGISASRDFRMTDEMPEGRGIAYLHLAGERTEWDELPEDSFKQIESFVRAGGRLVVAIFPEQAKPRASRFDKPGDAGNKTQNTDGQKGGEKESKANPPNSPKNRKVPANSGDEIFKTESIAEKWGLGFDVKNLKQGADASYEPVMVENESLPSLPAALAWHSGVVMTNLDKAWHVIYARGSDAVLAERKFGSGTVVFATDCYFMSNEALQKDRHAELLAWVVGPAREVMFDEAHFGIVDNPGIAMLMRKYRLGGLVLALLVLAVLFIWKNAAGLGPVREAEETEAWVAGKDSAAGFTNLLRHHIKPEEVLATSFAEWKKSFPRGTFSSARLERVEAFIQTENQRPAGERDAVKAYRAIAALLAKNTRFTSPNSDPKKP